MRAVIGTCTAAPKCQYRSDAESEKRLGPPLDWLTTSYFQKLLPNQGKYQAPWGQADLFGGGGNDEFHGYDGADTLYGYDGADTLAGGEGDDILFGEEGGDSLIGGQDHDTFVFGLGHGDDTIADFTNSSDGQDRIDLSAYGLSGYGDVSARQEGNHARIDLSAHDGGTIMLRNFDVADLDAGDFLF